MPPCRHLTSVLFTPRKLKSASYLVRNISRSVVSGMAMSSIHLAIPGRKEGLVIAPISEFDCDMQLLSDAKNAEGVDIFNASG